MLQNTTKQKDYAKKKQVSPGRRRTRDLRRVKATHFPLHHATIATMVGEINWIQQFFAHEILPVDFV